MRKAQLLDGSAKYLETEVFVIPQWTPLNKKMSFNFSFNHRKLKIIPILEITDHTGMFSNIFSCDKAIHQISKEIQWRTMREFKDMICQLGFQIAKNFLGVTAKLMGGSGFSEIS